MWEGVLQVWCEDVPLGKMSSSHYVLARPTDRNRSTQAAGCVCKFQANQSDGV